MFESLYNHTIEIFWHLIETPLQIGDRFYFLYVLTFVGLAYVSYRMYYRSANPSFLKFLFPKRIYLHKSARIDYAIYLINLFISPVTTVVGITLQTSVSVAVAEALVALNGGQPIFVGEWNTATYAVFILGFTLVADLTVYLIHRFHHSSDVFWPIHAVHHSAEVMTPFTLFRKHPLWNFMAYVFSKFATGLFQGLFVFVFFGNPGAEILFGLNTLYVVYNFFGSNLRHSHVWLSWGKPLSYLFISPAMHQIHHDPTRMKKNYGEVFAIWDWMFGTLYIPTEREEFDIGLGNGAANPHRTLAMAYYVPFVDVYRQIRAKVRGSERQSRAS